MPGKGSQAAVARLEHDPSRCSNLLFVGRRTRSWEQSPRERAKEWGGRHKALKLLAAHSSSLHREHTTKLGSVHLRVLEPSSSERSLVDGPLCQDGVQTLRGCGAVRHHCQPHFTPSSTFRSQHRARKAPTPWCWTCFHHQDQRQESQDTFSFSQHPEAAPNSTGHPRHCITPHGRAGRERTGCLSSHSPQPTDSARRPLLHLPPNRPQYPAPPAQELCLPPRDEPQSNETFTNTRVTLCPKKHPQNATERDSVGSTSCCRKNCPRAERWWLQAQQECGGSRQRGTVRLRGLRAQQQRGR